MNHCADYVMLPPILLNESCFYCFIITVVGVDFGLIDLGPPVSRRCPHNHNRDNLCLGVGYSDILGSTLHVKY